MERMPNIDYGELRFPISAWGMLVAQGLIPAEEAVRLSKDWLDKGGMEQFELKEGE